MSFPRFLVAAVVGVSAPAFAQDDPLHIRNLGGTIDLASAYQLSTDLDNGSGGFSVARVFAQPAISYAFNRTDRVAVAFGAGASYYDFDGSATLGGGEPWGEVRDLRLSVPIFYAPTEEIQTFLIPSVRWNAESGASFSDGQTAGAIAGFTYRFEETLSLGAGIGVFSELGGGTNIFPTLAIDWAITEDLSLSTGQGLAASQGPGLTLSYALDDTLSFGITARYENTRFALDDDGPAPDGIGQDTSFPILASVSYRPLPPIGITAFAGAEVGGELTLRDRDGNELDQSSYDPAPIFGLVLNARF